jgi:hypothetical protein
MLRGDRRQESGVRSRHRAMNSISCPPLGVTSQKAGARSQELGTRGVSCLLTPVSCLLMLCLWAPQGQAQPANYIGLGAGYNGGTTPNLNVTASYATLISKSGGLYSFTSGDYFSARTRPFSVSSSLRTGVAMVVRGWSHFTLLEMFNAGAAGGAGGVMPSLGAGAIGVLTLKNGIALAVDVHEAKAVGAGNWALQSVLQVGHVW